MQEGTNNRITEVEEQISELEDRIVEITEAKEDKDKRKTHETPPSSRDEGLLFLHGLESNPGSSLQTEEEAGLP